MTASKPINLELPYVYFVVVGWHNKDLLDTCFGSINQQTYPNIKIVYVDNGSRDGTLEFVKSKYPEVLLIDAKTNQGFAIGNNLGIKRALSDPGCGYVALLNTDATVDPTWTETITDFASTHKHSASFQTPTLDYYDHEILDSRGIKIDYAGRAIQLGYRESALKRYSQTKIFGVNAAACIYTAEFLRDQPFGEDYFDSDLWMYLEDVDLAARAIMLGYDNWLVEGARAYHMGSASSSKNPGFSVYYIYRNNALMLVKNFSLLRFLRMTPAIAFHDSQTLLSALRGRNYIAIRKIIKGRYHSLKMLGLFLKKAKVVKRGRVISRAALKQLMSAH